MMLFGISKLKDVRIVNPLRKTLVMKGMKEFMKKGGVFQDSKKVTISGGK